MNKLVKTGVWIFILAMTVGFRISKFRWEITPSDPTIWVKLCDNNSSLLEENDISGEPH